MRRRVLNAYGLHNKTLKWSRYEHKRLITKYLIKSTKTGGTTKRLISLKKWDEVRFRSISIQTTVCGGSGAFKKTLQKLGFNRHMARQQMNLGLIPNVRKLSW